MKLTKIRSSATYFRPDILMVYCPSYPPSGGLGHNFWLSSETLKYLYDSNANIDITYLMDLYLSDFQESDEQLLSNLFIKMKQPINIYMCEVS